MLLTAAMKHSIATHHINETQQYYSLKTGNTAVLLMTAIKHSKATNYSYDIYQYYSLQP